jgi:hypothetical protein
MSSKSELIRKASALYEKFSGHTATEGARIKIPKMPAVAVCIGDIDGILYTTVRDGVVERYIHKFRAKDKPLFAVSPDGKQLFMIGGNYNFTERGIIDESDLKNNR